MRGKSRWWSVVGLMFVAAVALTGCSKVSGGGWFQGFHGPAKVSFAFHGTCDTATGAAKGQLEYHDRAANYDLHGDVDNPLLFCQGAPDGGDVAYTGTYTPQPAKRGPGGRFRILVHDSGKPGPSNGDLIQIELSGGIYDGYFNTGFLKGGNIRAH